MISDNILVISVFHQQCCNGSHCKYPDSCWIGVIFHRLNVNLAIYSRNFVKWFIFQNIELIFILFCNLFLKTSSINIVNTVNPVYAVTFINQSPNSPVLKGHLSIILSIRFHINWTLRGHLSYKDDLSLSQKEPLNTGLTVYTSWCTMCFSYYLHKIWSMSWKAK